MTIIIEDGTGKADSNSYDSSENANAYFAKLGVETTIADSDMLMATKFIEMTYGTSYKGEMLTTTQALLFPRTDFYDNYNRKVIKGTIPTNLLEAVYQSAMMNSKGTMLIGNPNPNSQLSSETKSVDGAVSVQKTWFAPVSRSETSYIGKYISPILNTASLVKQLVRG